MGRLKISYNDLFHYSITDLKYLIDGHEIDLRDNWERERIAAYIAVAPHLQKNSGLTPQKLWTLPWDNLNGVPKFDMVNIDERIEQFKKRIDEHNKKIADKKDGSRITS